jgi:hypothetical protein
MIASCHPQGPQLWQVGEGLKRAEDDISLLWLKNPSETETAVGLLEDNISQAGIGFS